MFNYILDFIVTFCQLYGIWFLLIGLPIGFAIMVLFEDKERITRSKIFISMMVVFILLPFSSFFFVNFINPYFFHLGYIRDNFEVITHDENVLWTMDFEVLTTGGDGGDSPIVYRIQGVDMESGKKLFRTSISDDFKFLGNKDHLAFIRSGKDILGIEIKTGKTKITINEKSLMKTFPELWKGVHEYTFNPKTLLLDILSKDGIKFSIDPSKNTKIDTPIENSIAEQYQLNDYGISQNYTNILAFDGDTIQKLVDKNGKILNENITFLLGKFLWNDLPLKKVLILSYGTLDKKDFMLRMISLDGKLLWQVQQRDIEIGDFFDQYPPFEEIFLYQDSLIMSFRGFVFSLDITDGHLNWKTRL